MNLWMNPEKIPLKANGGLAYWNDENKIESKYFAVISYSLHNSVALYKCVFHCLLSVP